MPSILKSMRTRCVQIIDEQCMLRKDCILKVYNTKPNFWLHFPWTFRPIVLHKRKERMRHRFAENAKAHAISCRCHPGPLDRPWPTPLAGLQNAWNLGCSLSLGAAWKDFMSTPTHLRNKSQGITLNWLRFFCFKELRFVLYACCHNMAGSVMFIFSSCFLELMCVTPLDCLLPLWMKV